ncbi:Hypothetical protein VS_1369 [Vibrio atlanticus]|uniref:Uncharacterized protein n=1 Tax=Vibrio atlanticus (strain LGP32) TaxID=575788 RepID=B7VNF6_VIBA3|nr:Hypothetical protein VS_1369 [Vibrio atlanticus]
MKNAHVECLSESLPMLNNRYSRFWGQNEADSQLGLTDDSYQYHATREKRFLQLGL